MGQAARLKPRTAGIEFHYTALSLLVPENVRFKYQLVGFDKDWVEASARRVAYYTNLSPGKYRLIAYARSTVTGTFNNSQAADITVAATTSAAMMAVDGPANNSRPGGSMGCAC